jgi:hypothetical protein
MNTKNLNILYQSAFTQGKGQSMLFILFKRVTKDTGTTLSFLLIFNIKLFLYASSTYQGYRCVFSFFWLIDFWNDIWLMELYINVLKPSCRLKKKNMVPMIPYRRGMIDGLLCTTLTKTYFLSMYYKANEDSNVSLPVSPVNHIVCI